MKQYPLKSTLSLSPCFSVPTVNELSVTHFKAMEVLYAIFSYNVASFKYSLRQI